MTLQHLLAVVPWAMVATWVAANLIPYLAALATRAPSWATGAITLALSFVDALCGELARATGDPDWRLIVGNTLLVWAVAALHHSKILKGTPVEATLHAFPHAAPAPAKAAA